MTLLFLFVFVGGCVVFPGGRGIGSDWIRTTPTTTRNFISTYCCNLVQQEIREAIKQKVF